MEIVFELKDFDVTNIAINDVILSNDGSHAKVYITLFKDKERYFDKVTSMTPFIRSVVAKVENTKITRISIFN